MSLKQAVMAEAALLAPYPLSKQRRPRPRIGGPPRERTRKVPLLGWLRAVREGSDLGQSPVDLEGDGGEEVVHAAIAGEAGQAGVSTDAALTALTRMSRPFSS